MRIILQRDDAGRGRGCGGGGGRHHRRGGRSHWRRRRMASVRMVVVGVGLRGERLRRQRKLRRRLVRLGGRAAGAGGVWQPAVCRRLLVLGGGNGNGARRRRRRMVVTDAGGWIGHADGWLDERVAADRPMRLERRCEPANGHDLF